MPFLPPRAAPLRLARSPRLRHFVAIQADRSSMWCDSIEICARLVQEIETLQNVSIRDTVQRGCRLLFLVLLSHLELLKNREDACK